MSESMSIVSSAKIAGDAVALSLIDIRRVDRAAGKNAKRGDLTHKLKRQPKSAAPPAPAATVAPEAAPVAAAPITRTPELPPLPAFTRGPEPMPQAAPSIAPGPELAPLAAFAPEDAAALTVKRQAAPLPEPYLAPSDELAPSYIVGAPAVVLPSNQATTPALASDSAPLPYDDLRSADDLIYYWDELRAGRELPLFSKLDRTRIAISWPDTVMVNYEQDRAAVPQIARLSRLTGVVEFTSMVTEWILSCSRQVSRLGKAMETKRDFEGTDTHRSYHMLLLPFANPYGASDHVLCHLSCAD
jgi:hypothetical protein